MLVVGDRIQNEEAVTANRNVSVDEFIWPHGITPPLHHVRKRRFRKRVNKRVCVQYNYSCFPLLMMCTTDDRERRRRSGTAAGRRQYRIRSQVWWVQTTCRLRQADCLALQRSSRMSTRIFQTPNSSSVKNPSKHPLLVLKAQRQAIWLQDLTR